MSNRFATAAGLFREASTSEDRRLAMRVWLTDAILWAQEDGSDIQPAFALLAALEGLDFGHVDPVLKLPDGPTRVLPDGRKRGGVEAPPAETGLCAMALAAVDRLNQLGMSVSASIGFVADELGFDVGALTSKRKHVQAELGRSEAKRLRYRHLTAEYENERARMSDQSKDEIIWGICRVSRQLGLNGSPDPIP